jgi:tetratricopeptide (TPR) repeat protein
MRPVSDRSRLFTLALTASWLLLVALPIAVSILADLPLQGVPLLGVVVWFLFLRLGRALSPAARADALLSHGRAAEALALCDHALAVKGRGAWTGPRRLVWLNRRTTALLALGRTDDALTAALEAVALSPDPETLANCALALLRLNRDDEASRAARMVIELTRERSVLAHAVLATVKLALGMPAEAEALARSGLADVEALLPLVKPEHHVVCLAVLVRAVRALDEPEVAAGLLHAMRRAARKDPVLEAMALLEEVEQLADTPEHHARALALLEEAKRRGPAYARWYVTQRGTLSLIRSDEQVVAYRKSAATELQALAASAPDAARVAQALGVAAQDASPRPAPQASGAAISMQVLTLAGTLVVLLWWTVRFFVLN